MKCPKCCVEMQSGYIRTTGNGGICWVKNNKTGILTAPASDPEFEVIGKANYLKAYFIPAFKCSACKMLVADYSEC